MSIPWWVYLVSLIMIVFGVAIHFAPSFLARLEAQDRLRREELMAIRENEEGAGE